MAFIVSFFTSMCGISGGFLLLPFQMSVLNFTTPAVNSTNFVYNLIAIPSGVYRYIKEGRMAWPITWVVILGTTPGVLAGYYIRVIYFPDVRSFKFFVGIVLLYIAIRLLFETRKSFSNKQISNLNDKEKFSSFPDKAVVKTIQFSYKIIEYEFCEQKFTISTIKLVFLACIVGIVGGIYGIGGGALIAPICVSIFRLPIHSIAGAALMGTFLTSFVGIIFYSNLHSPDGSTWGPDWLLGFFFGIGGLFGMYCGARLQKFISKKTLNLFMGILVLSLSLGYILQYFF